MLYSGIGAISEILYFPKQNYPHYVAYMALIFSWETSRLNNQLADPVKCPATGLLEAGNLYFSIGKHLITLYYSNISQENWKQTSHESLHY